MKKSEFSRHFAEIAGVSNKEASILIDKFIFAIEECLTNDDPVKLKDFGQFIIEERVARNYKEPWGGKIIHKPAHRTVKFVFSRVLKTKLKKALNK